MLCELYHFKNGVATNKAYIVLSQICAISEKMAEDTCEISHYQVHMTPGHRWNVTVEYGEKLMHLLDNPLKYFGIDMAKGPYWTATKEFSPDDYQDTTEGK